MLKTGRIALLAAGTVWLAGSPGQALSSAPDPLGDALALLQTDPSAAVAALELLVAAYPLGRAYLLGTGVQQDPEKGTRLMQTAVRADPGNIDAQFLLGRAYQYGWGVPVDLDAARTHLTLAADSGDPRAQWSLGMLLIDGRAPTDLATAYRYVRQSAEQNFESGMISLAVMLAMGQGVTPDPAEARLLYARTAESGSAHALRALGMMILVGEGGASDPVKGAAYVELAAEGGDANAATLLRQFAEPLSQLPRTDIDAAKAKWVKDHGAPR